jgi:hypothetical protein
VVIVVLKGPDQMIGARPIPGPAEGPEAETAFPGLFLWCYTPKGRAELHPPAGRQSFSASIAHYGFRISLMH